MDSFEWNKIIGAVLGTAIFIFVIRLVAENVYETEKPAKPGYTVEGVVEESTGGAAPVAETMPDWGTVLAKADTGAGKTVSAKCEQCHDLSSAKATKIGPPLYGVVGRARASVAGFSYSSAMKAKGGEWTFDELFKFIHSPGAYIPGTKMSFAGVRRADDHINLIAFLRTNTDSPVAIPPPAPPAPAPDAAAGPATEKGAGNDKPTTAATATDKPADKANGDKTSAEKPATNAAAPADKGAAAPGAAPTGNTPAKAQ
jgi:cytochrome c